MGRIDPDLDIEEEIEIEPLNVDVNSLRRRLTSRKFLLAIIYAILVIVNEELNLGLPDEALNQILAAFSVFTAVQGVQDIVRTN